MSPGRLALSSVTNMSCAKAGASSGDSRPLTVASLSRYLLVRSSANDRSPVIVAEFAVASTMESGIGGVAGLFGETRQVAWGWIGGRRAVTVQCSNFGSPAGADQDRAGDAQHPMGEAGLERDPGADPVLPRNQ